MGGDSECTTPETTLCPGDQLVKSRRSVHIPGQGGVAQIGNNNVDDGSPAPGYRDPGLGAGRVGRVGRVGRAGRGSCVGF